MFTFIHPYRVEVKGHLSHLINWLEQNIERKNTSDIEESATGRWKVIGTGGYIHTGAWTWVFHFKKQSDAVLFKLTWCSDG